MEAEVIFKQFDKNNSGSIDLKEIYAAVTHAFTQKGLSVPTYNRTLELMLKDDVNYNGTLDIGEFKNLLNDLAKEAKR